MPKHLLSGLAIAIVALSLLGVGPGRSGTQTTVVVEMRDDVFDPLSVRIEPGDRVTWVSRGRNPHNVIANDGSFSSRTLLAGDSFTQTFVKPGVFPYYCSFHGSPGVGMVGVVLVGAEAAPYQRGNLAGVGSATRRYPERPPTRPSGGRTIRVPADAPTIQRAVDDARPGDLVLVAPGVYHEAVRVTVPHLTIRGEDRSAVILDGGFDPELKNGVAVFGADGVVIENMTARHYQLNGFYWRSVWGYRGSYLTAYNNGDYGIYAFDSGVGQFDHSFASGHPDSGFYIGQCDPCNAVITDVVARNNAIGYSGTNASGNLVIRDSEWADNMVGIVPNTLDSEALAPQRSVTIVNNRVHGNHNLAAPAKRRLYALFGNGILLLGGSDNEVAYNRVEDHPHAGIAVAPSIDDNLWIGHGNRVHDNVVGGSGLADLALIAVAAGGNCFAGNTFHTSLPPAVEQSYGCGSPLSAVGGGNLGLLFNGLGLFLRASGLSTHGDWRDRPAPPAQPAMPDSSVAPAPAGPADRVDVAAEVRAAARGDRRSDAPASPLAGNALYLSYGYGLPLLFVLAALLALLRVPRPRWLRGKRVLIGLPALYLAISLAILALAYLR